MKAYFTKTLMTCVSLLIGGIQANCAPQSVTEQVQAFATEGSLSNLAAVKVEIESLWPNDPVLYFQSNNQLELVLETLAKTNTIALQELETQARQALGRKCPTNSVDAATTCFDVKHQIAIRLDKNFSPSISNALALAEFIGEVRATIITNYHRAEVSVNIVPPLRPKNTNGMGYFEGMSPSVITDPVARAAYEKAIVDNGNNGKMNDFQTYTLPHINWEMKFRFLDYAKTALASCPDTNKQADTLAALAHLTKEEKRQLK